MNHDPERPDEEEGVLQPRKALAVRDYPHALGPCVPDDRHDRIRQRQEGYLPQDTAKNIMMREDQDGATYLVHMAIDRNPADPGRKTVGGLFIQKSIAEDLGVKTDDIKTTSVREARHLSFLCFL